MSHTIYENEPKDYLTEHEQAQFNQLIAKINNGRKERTESKSTTVSTEEINFRIDNYLKVSGLKLDIDQREYVENRLTQGNRERVAFRSEFTNVFDEIQNPVFTNSDDQDEEVSQKEMANMLDEYISFNGIGISNAKRLEILNYLDGFRNDPDNLRDEIVCEVRTANGD